jgi:hypothetical protein
MTRHRDHGESKPVQEYEAVNELTSWCKARMDMKMILPKLVNLQSECCEARGDVMVKS